MRINRVILTIIIISLSIIIGISYHGLCEEKEVPMQKIEKDEFLFELKLLNQRELSEVCSNIEVKKNDFSEAESYDDLAYPPCYVFGSVQCTKNSAAWITFEVFSPNNKTMSSPDINITKVYPNKSIKTYFLIPVSFSPSDPYVFKNLPSKDKTILDVKIKSKFFK